jgi:hypothetical protein
MSRYYFNLREDDELIPDDEGVELPTIQSARDEAIRGLADCARDAIRNAVRAELAVEVLDDGRKTLFIAKLVFEMTFLYHEDTNQS